jgi:hypothetical protein
VRGLIPVVKDWRRQGTHDFLAHRYRTRLRDHLPEADHITHNGVVIARRRRLFDAYLPTDFHRVADEPGMEGGVVNAHEANTRRGNDVVVVGGGDGVTAVRAARIVGPEGSVRVFEGAEENVERIRRAFELNGVTDRCTVERAVVGPPRNVWGDTEGAPRVAPSELPSSNSTARGPN